jgi:hypothetical protein
MTNLETYGDRINEEFQEWLEDEKLLADKFPTHQVFGTGVIYYHFDSEHDIVSISNKKDGRESPRPTSLIDVYNIPFNVGNEITEEEGKEMFEQHIKALHEAYFKVWSENDSKKEYDKIHGEGESQKTDGSVEVTLDENGNVNSYEFKEKKKGFFSRLFS